jgi:hypothetical protein
MALKNRPYVNGNTVLKPRIDVAPERIDEDLRKLKKSRQDFMKRNAMRNNKMKMGIISTLLFIGIFSSVTVFRSAQVYNLQKEFVSIQTETRNVSRENEALRAELIKAGALGDIVTRSSSLDLVEADNAQALVVNLDRENFMPEETVAESRTIMDVLFSFLSFMA